MTHVNKAYVTLAAVVASMIIAPSVVVIVQAQGSSKSGMSAGSTILMSQYLMHRDKRFFLEPERFNPDRWNNDTGTNLPRFSYFPFGGGPRACIGEPFAWTEGIVDIAIIARRWIMKIESILVDWIICCVVFVK